jgi:hypothetical protein
MRTKQVTVADLVAARQERDTYRDLCAELIEALKSAKQTAEFENHPFRGWHKAADDVITKAEAILGEKK